MHAQLGGARRIDWFVLRLAAAERVRKLEESGVIKGYAALIDPDSIGCGLAALISLTIENPEYRPAIIKNRRISRNLRMPPRRRRCRLYPQGPLFRNPRSRKADQQRNQIVPRRQNQTTVILSTIKETPVLPLSRGAE